MGGIYMGKNPVFRNLWKLTPFRIFLESTHIVEHFVGFESLWVLQWVILLFPIVVWVCSERYLNLALPWIDEQGLEKWQCEMLWILSFSHSHFSWHCSADQRWTSFKFLWLYSLHKMFCLWTDLWLTFGEDLLANCIYCQPHQNPQWCSLPLGLALNQSTQVTFYKLFLLK